MLFLVSGFLVSVRVPLGAHLRPNSPGSPQDRTKLAHPMPAVDGNFPGCYLWLR
jgi:hypothetical protein